jgi:arginyl-tRNA--protein-N-Asp/Glu arginylyltransferase
MSEKIAFLTMEMGITPEEAQAFWPVYNQVDKERDEAVRKVFQSFKALEDAVSASKSEKEISKLLDAYQEALEQQANIESQASARYEKVLSVEKLAKLYVGEEKFRRQQVRRLHVGGNRPGPM